MLWRIAYVKLQQMMTKYHYQVLILRKLSEITINMQTELQNNSEKLSKFENSVEERQNFENSFYEKLQQNDDKISLSSADTQKKLSEITTPFGNRSFKTTLEELSRIRKFCRRTWQIFFSGRELLRKAQQNG